MPPTQVCGKIPSMKLVPGARKVGDHSYRGPNIITIADFLLETMKGR